MKKTVLYSILIISNLCYAYIDCENTTTNDDLIMCSKQNLEQSIVAFSRISKQLVSSEMINLKQKKKLKEHYAKSKDILSETCKSMFEGSRLRSMYVNDCISEQLDILSESQKRFICTQQDADACTENDAK